ncbi:hypothetical protein CEXT_2611 [Caerostris extrusa]|uniref:Uncharacterized protein n=1 Tax=Caerostris extrusa TaxID=172846 RepID=A0AAV4R1M1_CAEEX|nr:hypothetical protein CEXT_2611 [Caerostris extrusa]
MSRSIKGSGLMGVGSNCRCQSMPRLERKSMELESGCALVSRTSLAIKRLLLRVAFGKLPTIKPFHSPSFPKSGTASLPEGDKAFPRDDGQQTKTFSRQQHLLKDSSIAMWNLFKSLSVSAAKSLREMELFHSRRGGGGRELAIVINGQEIQKVEIWLAWTQEILHN